MLTKLRIEIYINNEKVILSNCHGYFRTILLSIFSCLIQLSKCFLRHCFRRSLSNIKSDIRLPLLLFCFIAFSLCYPGLGSFSWNTLVSGCSDCWKSGAAYLLPCEESADSSERIITGSSPVFIGITLSVLYLILPLLWFYYNRFIP